MMPIAIDTDVNAAAVAEFRIGGHGPSATSVAYVTVGTGVGVGLVCDGRTVRGALHPEMGHVRPALHAKDASFEGCCPFHGACVEGLVASGALEKRFGVPAASLAQVDDDHEQWDIVAFYLASLCATIALTTAPHAIVISGGIMNRRSLFPLIRKHFREQLNGYLNSGPFLDETYIRPSKFGDSAGVVGAAQLAFDATESRPK